MALGCPGPGTGRFMRAAGGSMLYQFGHGKKYQKNLYHEGKNNWYWYNCKTDVGMNMYEVIY